MNIKQFNPAQKGYRKRLLLLLLGYLRKALIKWGLFISAMIGITLTCLSRLILLIALASLEIIYSCMTGLFHAYEKFIAVILHIVI